MNKGILQITPGGENIMSPDTVKKLKFSLIYKMFLNRQLSLEESSVNERNYIFCVDLDCESCKCFAECKNLSLSMLYSRGIVTKEHFEELLELHPEMRIVL